MSRKRDPRLLTLTATLAICLLGPSGTGLSQNKKLSAAETKDHIGEQATVCGKVASTRYAATTRRKPTFLNLDKPYPTQLFTILIGGIRERFGTSEEKVSRQANLRDWQDHRIPWSARNRGQRFAEY
jgi:hypothetical protein